MYVKTNEIIFAEPLLMLYFINYIFFYKKAYFSSQVTYQDCLVGYGHPLGLPLVQRWVPGQDGGHPFHIEHKT